MFSIHDEEAIKKFFSWQKIPLFRYAQIENALYKNFVFDFEAMQTIPKTLREQLIENFFFFSLTCYEKISSENGQTTKILFKTSDGFFVESVIMRHLTGRNTLCISCQAGCAMGCSFCATGKLGLQRNLTFYEIVEQVMFAAKLLNEEGVILRNVVYMGMGEPFLNYENVKKSIQIICEQKKLNLANRRVTVSSCGIIPWIQAFMNDFSQTSLAISLHAPNDEVRNMMMSVNKKYPLADLMQTLLEYEKKTNKRIFYEYIMIQWVNDSLALATELAQLLEWRLAHVNFIPYNSWEGRGGTYKAPSRIIIENFQRTLEKYGIPSTIRATMGDDIDAACWQLARKKGEEEKE